jgi:phosphoglycolate phosphatase
MPQLLAPVILFDLDGTLTDSAQGILASFEYALAKVDWPAPSREVLDDVVGPPMRDTLSGLGMRGAELEDALADYFERYDAKGWAENTVFDGIPSLLSDLREAGARLAVATSKSERFAVRILEHFDLAGHFEFIGAASEDGARRRKADVIAHTLDALALDPGADGLDGTVVMIGDRVHDVSGAKANGIPAIAVEWGYGDPVEHEGARWTAPDVDALRLLLLRGTN